jgi:hypothetical protein
MDGYAEFSRTDSIRHRLESSPLEQHRYAMVERRTVRIVWTHRLPSGALKRVV